MSSNQYGLPLANNITQSILPVIINSGRLMGFLALGSPISYTANTTIPTATINSITIQPQTVTLPQLGVCDINSYRISQYVAYVIDVNEEYTYPWIAFSSFVSNDESGWYSRWVVPATGGGKLNYSSGDLLNRLKFNISTAYTAPSSPSAPTANNSTMNWVCNVKSSGFNNNPNAFFDFNWMVQFGTPRNGSNPARISIVSNPSGGYFKAMIVASNGQPIGPTGALIFDTVRIICLNPPPAADYVFHFAVTDTNNLTTDVTLTVTVTN